MPSLEAGLKRFIWIIAAFLVASAGHPLSAQDGRERRAPEQRPRVPESFTPPAGMCRLWIDGVPASQQPAPTDCANAIRNRPSNAAVLFGPQRRGESMELRSMNGRAGLPFIRQLAPKSLTAHPRDDARERTVDTTAKPAPRKPEKPR